MICMRAITLSANIDVIPHTYKQHINHIFTHNPEEIRAYPRALRDNLLYATSIKQSVNKWKKYYETEQVLHHHTIEGMS